MPAKVIDKFSGTVFSNFHTWYDPHYEEVQSVEHWFQAMKTNDFHEQRYVLAAPTARDAKRRGHEVKLREDWDEIKDQVMLVLLRVKFADPERRDKLLATGDAVLIEGNTWHDQHFGDCRCHAHKDIPGENILGKLLMQVREELRPLERNPVKAKVAAQSGMARAFNAPDVEEWKQRADAWLATQSGKVVTSDDLVAAIGHPSEGPEQNNVVGAWWSAKARTGAITHVGYTKSERVIRHGNSVREWEVV